MKKVNLKRSLEFLFVSKVRIKILWLFFSHPDVPYHIRGVVREIDEEINAVRRELLRLEEIKLLLSERKGNRLYFTIQSNFVFYPELLNIIHKSYGLGREIIKSRKKLGKIEYAFLTRAFTKGIRTTMQEVDLVIIGDVDMNGLQAAVQRAERETGREVNYTVMKGSEFTLRKKRKDAFLVSILAGSKVMLIGDEDELVL